MKKIGFFLLLLCIIMLFISCADVSDITYNNPNEHIYGFWGGTWHGMIMLPSFICSLIWDDIAVYAVHNNGAWYNFGFVGGFFMILRVIINVFKIIKKK